MPVTVNCYRCDKKIIQCSNDNELTEKISWCGHTNGHSNSLYVHATGTNEYFCQECETLIKNTENILIRAKDAAYNELLKPIN